MRLAKYVQIAIGLAASSGVAVVLSGSALADTVGLNTTSQDVSTHSTLNQTAQTPVAPTDGPGQGGGPVISPGATPPVVSGTEQSSETTKSTDQSSSQTTTTISQSNEPPASPGVSSDGQAGGTSGTTAPTVGANQPTAQSSIAPGASKSLEAGPAVIMVTPMMAAASDVSTVQPVFHRTALAIQPVITTQQAELGTDLAATVPSAPESPAKAPARTKSNGWFGGLAAELGTIVVPQPFLTHVAPIAPVVFTLSLVTLLALLVNVFTFSFGLWLRRGGFATAARSDVPATQSIFSFATPRFLGYVERPPRYHSPIFVVAETKSLRFTNAYRKEDTR